MRVFDSNRLARFLLPAMILILPGVDAVAQQGGEVQGEADEDGDEIARGRFTCIAHDGSVRPLNDGVATIERCCGGQAAGTCAQV